MLYAVNKNIQYYMLPDMCPLKTPVQYVCVQFLDGAEELLEANAPAVDED